MYDKRAMSCGLFNQTFSGMSLTKIPFVILTTWGINASYKPPNPTPPKHERISTSSVPLEKSGFFKWAPIIARVSNFLQNIF
jgi:hypothetical protein